MEDMVIVGGVQYSVEQEPAGGVSLLRYNEEYKKWIRLRFGKVDVNNSIEDFLSKQYVERKSAESANGEIEIVHTDSTEKNDN